MERTISVLSDRNIWDHLCSFPFEKIVVSSALFCILLTRTITKRAVGWDGSVQPECTVPLLGT